ncbi:MAG: TetR/AcrR family transcriptional regulator [Porticoccaceae bacterium]|nr:TetR/AcrR family transcriptional regulator [Pseudomonadales bacterium]MCP5170918.1 TetR/AcrR family transcriptional regulator [Pseudomonadales bacterium]MCP5301842.1 TetR/AcrR family transcriptional regulator [Pseudomonadales bacterium]
MKRRELILVVSLELFNREGEANLSAVDIANELDISPGNLYYHFKGKEELVEQLFARFEDGMTALLHDPINSHDALEDNWLKFYILFEEIYRYRFIYRNLFDIGKKYPGINRRLHALLELKHSFVVHMLQSMVARGVFDERSLTVVGLDELADSISLTLSYWISYQRLRRLDTNQHDFIQSGILQIVALLAPYMGDVQRQFMARCHELYQQQVVGE